MRSLQAQLNAMGDERLYDACLVQLAKDSDLAPFLREVVRRWREAPKPQRQRRQQLPAVANWSKRDREEVEKLLRTVSSINATIERLLPRPQGGVR